VQCRWQRKADLIRKKSTHVNSSPIPLFLLLRHMQATGDWCSKSDPRLCCVMVICITVYINHNATCRRRV
jgi:hypothetical protein